jgi:hypothetical protein
VFLGHPKRKFCEACQTIRIKRQNRASAQQCEHQRVFIDLSGEHIDRLFATALAEIRRTRAHRLDAPSFDYRNRYREP